MKNNNYCYSTNNDIMITIFKLYFMIKIEFHNLPFFQNQHLIKINNSRYFKLLRNINYTL